jgi:hypothetical protein
MRFESSLGAIGLALAAIVAISQTSLAQSPIDKISNRRDRKVHRDRYPGFAGFNARTVARAAGRTGDAELYLNGKVEQFSAKTERASSFSWRPARARKLRDFFRSCRMPKPTRSSSTSYGSGR